VVNSGVGNHQYWNVINMPLHIGQVTGKGPQNKKLRVKKAPIVEVPNPLFSEEVLDARVHIPKDEHLKRYVEQAGSIGVLRYPRLYCLTLNCTRALHSNMGISIHNKLSTVIPSSIDSHRHRNLASTVV